MISTKHIVSDISDIPSMFVFEFYLNLPRKLTGQSEMIRSVFGPKDTTPSMSIYVSGNQYKFNDFSTGIKGDKITLIIQMEKVKSGIEMTFPEACNKLIQDYNQYILDHNGDSVSQFKEHARYQIKSYTRRKWTVTDQTYWQQYEISSDNLEGKNAFPLGSYVMSNGKNSLTIQGKMIYGYFTNLGEIYKVYQPMAKDRRFMKVKSHIQGLDQLTGKYSRLIIGKSLKDVLTLDNLQLESESISPDSENTMLTEKQIFNLKERYKQIICILDNDEPGIKAMKQYNERFGLPYIISPLEKDPSDSVKKLGSEVVRPVFLDLINKI